MLLKKVLEEINKNETVSYNDIAKKLDISLEDVAFAVNYWMEKGKLKGKVVNKENFNNNNHCGGGCKGCKGH